MGARITDLRAHDVRFPTSDLLDGSDAMNPDPDYSAAFAILETDDANLEGHGMTFTIGRGNEVCVTAIEAFRALVVGWSLDEIESDLGGFWRRLAAPYRKHRPTRPRHRRPNKLEHPRQCVEQWSHDRARRYGPGVDSGYR